MKMPSLPQILILIVALTIGLAIGLGIGRMQIKKEQKVFQDKLKEASKKIAFIQKKMTEEKNEATASIEQECQGDLDKLEKAQNEKKALGGQLGKLKEQLQKLETKGKESDEASARNKKEIQEMELKSKDLDRELKKMTGENQALQAELKKTAGEKQALQGELKKTTEGLGHCESDNAELVIIAEELLKKYRDKGLGSVLAQKEPLTQIKKVQLEHFIQQYQEEIEKQKIKKNDAGGKNVSQ
jgi:chromosome segregation ATPase